MYSYKADTEGDPFNEAASLWSFNYFFFNRKLKRIVCFTAMACSKLALAGSAGEYAGDYGEDDLGFEMEED